MKTTLLSFSLFLVVLASSHPAYSNSKSDMKTIHSPYLQELSIAEPEAAPKPFSATYHGKTYSDPWHWLRDSDYPKAVDDKAVLDYLHAENEYFQAFKTAHKPFIDKLFKEFKGRLDETESSVPWQQNGYVYRWQYEDGNEYKTWYRKPITGGSETVFLDEAELAKGEKYFVLGRWQVSPNNRYLAYTIDTAGDERYDIYVKDLKTGKMLDDKIGDSSRGVGFAADSQHIVYGKLKKERWWVEHINSHKLGTPTSQDKSLYQESDQSFFLSFGFTLDKQFLIISTGTGSVSELRVMDANLTGPLNLLASRDLNFEYDISHAHGQFYIVANDQHVNSRIAVVSSKKPAYKNWKTLIPGRDDTYFTSLQTHQDFFVTREYIDGLQRIVIRGYNGEATQVSFPEKVFGAVFGKNEDFAQDHFRIQYQSMITPKTIYDYNVKAKSLTTKQVTKIPSGYDKTQYETVRLMAPARDGVEVPVTLMYKKGTKLDGTNPLHLYAYGAYGSGMSPNFSTTRLSLVDRGVVYGIAHIRGGDEKGYQWYLDGKLKKRTNTFNDFVDVARFLIDKKYTAAGNISISGGSAGGELMGAVINQAPELWSSVTLSVPFVDVLNTMLDASLPLTPPEWSEWGNPITDPEAYDLILSYSPYDNIEKKDYPPMFVTGGLHDPRVTYWEPAKWTAKMRAYKTDTNLLMMRMNMNAGHFANSGRYGRQMDYAEGIAFALLSHGIKQ